MAWVAAAVEIEELGSRTQLRAYMKSVIQQGGAYVPKYISQAEFDAIAHSPIEKVVNQ